MTRKGGIKATFGLLLSLLVIIVFVWEAKIIENLENTVSSHSFVESIRLLNNDGDQQPQKALKQTSVNVKKPPPPKYSNKSFVDCQILRPGDSIYQYGPWDVAPIVVESHKLIFFTVPKVGSTVFKQLFRRMEGYLDYLQDEHPLPHAPKRNGLKYLYDFEPHVADSMLTDPSFTRAIFLRDPKERLLSSYLDKGRQNAYLQFHCCRGASPELYKTLDCANPREHLGPAADRAGDPLVSFHDFLNFVIPSCSDPHWMPQAYRMEGKYWKYINFVGRFETLENDTRKLLKHIGAWDDYGAVGWPNGHIFAGSATVSHKTGSSTLLEQFFTEEAELLAQSLLRRDYELPLSPI